MRKDVLAAGARKASFAGGVGDNDITRNIMSDEDRAALEAAQPVLVEDKPKPRKSFRPLGDVLLVRRAEPESPSGILITETMEKDKPAEGDVLAIGASVTTVKVGERVVFGKYAGQEYKLNGEVLLLMELREIQGIVEDEPDMTVPDYVLRAEGEDSALEYRVQPGVQVGEA